MEKCKFCGQETELLTEAMIILACPKCIRAFRAINKTFQETLEPKPKGFDIFKRSSGPNE